MNYAIAFLGLIIICALGYWWIGARKWYVGPIQEAQVIPEGDGQNDGIDDESGVKKATAADVKGDSDSQEDGSAKLQ